MAHSKWQRALIIVSLIFAGEAIFTLPYHVTRFFRPTFLEVFELSATELGVAQSAYGFIAMAAYFFGGPLADRFEPRKLLAGSLWATALGGLYLATFPDVTGVMLVWGFFGLTNILQSVSEALLIIAAPGTGHFDECRPEQQDVGQPKKAPDQHHTGDVWKGSQVEAAQCSGP